MTAPDLDLAFTLDGDLDPGLCRRAGTWADPAIAEDRWRQLLQTWLGHLQPRLTDHLRAASYSLGLRLCGDAAMAQLNQDWRQQPGPTDVLSFATSDGEELPPIQPGQPLELGDVVISLDTAQRQASEATQELGQELLFLASHGLLHLLGWDHPDESSLAAMLNCQEELRGLVPAAIPFQI